MPAFDPASYASQFKPMRYAIWLNSLWFSSLVLSLASATMGIIVKQWLRRFKSGLYGDSPEVARRRQYRLNNLLKWKVPIIISLIPMLVIIALVLFFAGLVFMLGHIHSLVFAVVTTFIAISLFFILATTILPSLFNTCCYHSPQAVVVTFIWTQSSHKIAILFRFISSVIATIFVAPMRTRRLPEAFSILGRLGLMVAIPFYNLSRNLHETVVSLSLGSKESREHDTVARTATRLDADTAIIAFSTSLNATYLETAQKYVSSWGEYNITSRVNNASLLPENPLLLSDHIILLSGSPQVQTALYGLMNRAMRTGIALCNSECQLKLEMEMCSKAIYENTTYRMTRKTPIISGVHDEFLRLLAVISMGYRINIGASNRAWEALFLVLEEHRSFSQVPDDIRRIGMPFIYCTGKAPIVFITVALAAVKRIFAMKHDPRLLVGPPKRWDTLVESQLKFKLKIKAISEHLEALWKATKPKPISHDHSAGIRAEFSEDEAFIIFREGMQGLRKVLRDLPWEHSVYPIDMFFSRNQYLKLLQTTRRISKSKTRRFSQEIDEAFVA